MLRQCAGCGTCFDDKSGKEDQIPRPYGCCEACNASTFRSNELLGGAAKQAPVPAAAEKLDDLLAKKEESAT